MLAELDPKPDQVTVTINTSQMNVVEHWEYEDYKGTSFEDPAVFNAYKEMTVPSQPGWAEEHIRRLSAAGIGGDEGVFRGALEAVSPTLAEAA